MARSWLLAALLCIGCGAASVEVPPPRAPKAPPLAPAVERPPPAPPPASKAPEATAQVSAPRPLLEAVVEAGEIPRPTLLAVLSAGVGRFLQKLRAEAKLASGRFVGWTLTAFEQGPDSVLAPGDTVLRVNGQSIERPEQFKNVWDSLATESELVLLVDRGGQQSQVRYRITD